MRTTLASALALAVLLGGAAPASAQQHPTRTLSRPGPVVSLGLTGASVAFAVGRTARDCDHVELWNADARTLVRFGPRKRCGDLPVLAGIGSIGVATSRVVWVTYAGGNLTDWQLWTATKSKRTPRRIAFVERDTSDPAPIVVGQGTPDAVPYAIDNEITLLRDNGTAAFRWTAPAPVRALTTGAGPYGWTVAALLANGEVVVLDAAGGEVQRLAFSPGNVRWIGLAAAGLLVQTAGAKVEVHRGAATQTLQLPANAIVLDAARNALLYRVGQSFSLRDLVSGADTPLLRGSAKHPILAALDEHGLAWARATSLSWACAACIGS